jgi:ribonuclease E
VEPTVVDEEDADDEEDEEDEAAAGEAAAEADGETPARRKSRRGSRGGRRRRKKPGAGAEAQAEPDADDAGAEVSGAAEDEEVAEAPVLETDGAAGPEPPRAPSRRRSAPRIHVPSTDLEERDDTDGETAAEPAAGAEAAASTNGAGDGTAVEGAPAKKRTRRGSRGGRNRRKKPATQAPGEDDVPEEGLPEEGAAGEEPELEPVAPAPTGAEAEEGGYVPMSEWLDDFDRGSS